MMVSLKIGPCEDSRRPLGNEWSLTDETKILQIRISHDTNDPPRFIPCRIKSLQFLYLKDGQLCTSDIIGDSNFSGRSFHAITVDYPGEYITGVEGDYYGGYFGSLSSLIIETNRNKYGPFGLPPKASLFSYKFGPENVFGGFHGTHDSSGVASIGVYVNPPVFSPPPAAGPSLCHKCKRQESEGDVDHDNNQVLID